MASDQIEALVTRLGDKDGGVRQRARETLAAIGEPALPALLELLASPQVRMRWEAAKALTESPDPVAIPGLVALLADDESDLRWLAAIGLVNIGNRSLPYVLQVLTERAESKGLREASHHVFRDLSDRNGVIRGILEPVLEVLGDTDAIGVIYARAEVALRKLRTLRGG